MEIEVSLKLCYLDISARADWDNFAYLEKYRIGSKWLDRMKSHHLASFQTFSQPVLF
jgi:hypothetical protein